MKGLLLVIGMSLVGFGLIFAGWRSLPKQTVTGTVLAGQQSPARGLIIPHHLVAERLIRQGLETFVQNTNGPMVIYLLVPNHHEAGNVPVVTSERWLATISPATGACVNQQILALPFVRTIEPVVDNEHAVMGIVPLILESSPQAPVLPLMISAGITNEEIEILANRLSGCAGTVAVASLDFSHYLPTEEADKRDAITWQMISAGEIDRLRGLNNEYVDSPAALVIFLKLMHQWGANNMNQLAHENSGRILGNLSAATTSYLVAIFQ